MSKREQQDKTGSQNSKFRIVKLFDVIKDVVKNPGKFPSKIAEDALKEYASKEFKHNSTTNHDKKPQTPSISNKSFADQDIDEWMSEAPTSKNTVKDVKSNNYSVLKSIADTTKDIIKHPSSIIKNPIEAAKDFDPIIFKMHAKKHPIKTAALLAVGGLAVGTAVTVAVLAAPAAIAIGGVGAVVVGAAAVAAGSVAIKVTADKLSVDGQNTINNLNSDEKKAYDQKVNSTWDKKIDAASIKNEKEKAAKQRNAEKIAKIKIAVTDIKNKFKFTEQKINNFSEKPTISVHPDDTPKQSTQPSRKQSFHL